MRKIFRALLFCRCVAVKLEDRDSFRKRSMAIEDLHEPKSPGWVRTPFTKNGAEKKISVSRHLHEMFAPFQEQQPQPQRHNSVLLLMVRNPVNSPVEFGSWNPIVYRVLWPSTIQRVVGLGTSEAAINIYRGAEPNKVPTNVRLGWPETASKSPRRALKLKVSNKTMVVFIQFHVT